jgi:5'-nucleotidase
MRSRRLFLSVLAAGVITVGSSASSFNTSAGAAPISQQTSRTANVRLLAFNDLHGNIEAASTLTFAGAPAGGAAFLATHLAAKEAERPNGTLVLSIGDQVGASPLASALFQDEPTVEFMNTVGVDVAALGNHELDDGFAEFKRLFSGGCGPTPGTTGCFRDGATWKGANFPVIAGNVLNDKGPAVLPGVIVQRDGARIAVLSAVTKTTPNIVTPSGVAGLTFVDEIAVINFYATLVRPFVDAVVVTTHEGGTVTSTDPNKCDGPTGRGFDIANALVPAVDVVITAHSHRAYNCLINGKTVTQASSFGRLFTQIDLTIDKRTKKVTAKSATNVVVTRDVTPNAAVASNVAFWADRAGPVAQRQVGTITSDLTDDVNAAGESVLGNVIADSQLAGTAQSGAKVAFMNPGGIRTDVLFARSGSEATDGIVTYGETFAVQPFGNSLVVMDLTGTQLDLLLEQQWINQSRPRVLQVSKGFSYTWSEAAAVGAKVDIATIKIDGVAIEPSTTYRVVVNSFLADGGDGFAVLRDGTNRVGGPIDLDALAGYLGANNPLTPPTLGRITTAP